MSSKYLNHKALRSLQIALTILIGHLIYYALYDKLIKPIIGLSLEDNAYSNRTCELDSNSDFIKKRKIFYIFDIIFGVVLKMILYLGLHGIWYKRSKQLTFVGVVLSIYSLLSAIYLSITGAITFYQLNILEKHYLIAKAILQLSYEIICSILLMLLARETKNLTKSYI